MSYQSESQLIADLFMAKMMRQEQKEFLLLADRWGVVTDNLEGLILKLAEKENKSPDQLFRSGLYQQFLDEAHSQIKDYSQIASGVISNGQVVAGKLGIGSVQKMIEIKTDNYRNLPVTAINRFIGKSFSDGAKLDSTLFAKSYPDYINKTKEILLQGVALGKSPIETARMIRKESTAPLWKSLRLARTESMAVYRESSTMQMLSSGVVRQRERLEQDDACDFCQSVNGNRYDLDGGDDEFHPNCRGCYIPVL